MNAFSMTVVTCSVESVGLSEVNIIYEVQRLSRSLD